jgi:glyoxylase-like metal-dependent hydrolase (beta-lactamase superfamily II)
MSAFCLAAVLVVPTVASAQPADSRRSPTITQLAGDLYRVQDGERTTVFMVAADGIVLVDPLSTATAAWLKDELAARFPGRPVRWVIYTHHHEDRASGGRVFAPAAAYIAQGRFNAELRAASTALEPPLAALDENHDGKLQQSEIARSPRAATLLPRDLNADGVVTAAEAYADVVESNEAFGSLSTLTAGAHDVLLASAPTSHASDMTAIVFPMQRIAFAADLFPIRSVPQQLGPEKVPALIASMRHVEQLPFDVLITGSGEMLAKTDLEAYRQYLEALYAAVRLGRAAGHRVSELQDTVTLDQFSQWSNFDNGRRANIAEVYQDLKRIAVTLTLAGSYGSSSADTCRGTDGCTFTVQSKVIPDGGVRIVRQRFTVGLQMYRFPREATHYPKQFRIVELQDTIVAIPVGIAVGSLERGPSVTVEGGPAIGRARSGTTTFAKISGLSDEFHAANSTTFGWSAGAVFEFHVRPRVAMSIPIHFVQQGADPLSVRRSQVMLGAGASIALMREYR